MVDAGGEAIVRASGSAASVVARDRVVVEAADEVSVRAGDEHVRPATRRVVPVRARDGQSAAAGRAILARGQTSLIATEDCACAPTNGRASPRTGVPP